MIVKRAYRYRLRSSKAQESSMEGYAGQCRFVWNWFLSQREAWYQSGASEIPAAQGDPNVNPNNDVAQANQLPALKKQYPWLTEAPSQLLKQTLRDLDRAYKDFFKNQSGYPQYRKKGQKDSFRFSDPKGFRLEGKLLRLPKLGDVLR